jgi:virginiamycin B lyase
MAAAALIAGSDGNLWWVDANSDAVGRTTPRGTTTVFHIPGGTQPRPELVAAPDGTLWGADFNGKLLHITMAGVVTEVDASSPLQGNGPFHLTAAPDGALWYAGGYPLALYRRDAAGTTTSHSLQGTYPVSLTWGPDSALWFGETVSGGQGIGRFDPATNSLRHFAVPGPPDFVGPPVLVPDGNLWFGENSRGNVARITPQGVITEFPLPRYGGQQLTVNTLLVGRDGALWSTAGAGGHSGNALLRITVAGAPQVIPVTGVGGSEAYVYNVANGPDGHMWTLMGEGYQASTGRNTLVRDNR